MSGEEAAFHWFETLCDQLCYNPEAATDELSKFRDSNEAFNISSLVIQNSRKHHVLFHALSVYQHSFLSHYRQFGADQKAEARKLLWLIIVDQNSICRRDRSSFSKLLNVFANVLKRSWIDDSAHVKAEIFNEISSLLAEDNPSNDDARFRVCSQVLQAIVEAFPKKKRTPDECIGYSPELQYRVHQCFQNDSSFCGLSATYEITFQLLSRAFELEKLCLYRQEPSNSANVVFDLKTASTIKHIFNLVGDVLSWEFKIPTGVGIPDEGTLEGNDCAGITIPDSWVKLAGGPSAFYSILRELLTIYDHIRIALFRDLSNCMHCGDDLLKDLLMKNGCSFGCEQSLDSVHGAGEYISSIRQLLLAFSSFASKSNPDNGMFSGDSDRVGYSNLLLSNVVPVIGFSITSKIDPRESLVSGSVPWLIIEDLMLHEVEHAIYILSRLLGNFHLSIVGQASAFESFVVELGRVTYELAKKMAAITEQRTKANEIVEMENVLDAWQGDVLSQLMDLWSMILDDSILHKPVAIGASENSLDNAIASNLKIGLSGMAGEIFLQLFDCIVLISLQDVLSGEEEDLDEDLEYIALRNLDEFLKGICLIGRSIALWVCVGHVSRCLEKSLEDTSMLQQQAQAGSAVSKKSCVQQLEVQRICCLFLSHLLFEGRTSQKTATLSSPGSESTSRDQDIAVPSVITESFSLFLLQLPDDNSSPGPDQKSIESFKSEVQLFQEQILQVIPQCAKSLELQQQAIEYGKLLGDRLKAREITSDSFNALRSQISSFQSPLLMQSWLEFFSDFTMVYFGADARRCTSSDLALVVRLSCGVTEDGGCSTERMSIRVALKNVINSTNHSPQMQQLLIQTLEKACQSVASSLWQMGSEQALVISGLDMIKAISLFLSGYNIHQMLSVSPLQTLLMFVSQCGEEEYNNVTSRLSLDCLSKLWECVGSLAIRLVISASAVAITHVPGCNDFDQESLHALPMPVSDIIGLFEHICSKLNEQFKILANGSVTAVDLSVALSLLRGVSRWPIHDLDREWQNERIIQVDAFGSMSEDDLRRQQTMNALIDERHKRIREMQHLERMRLYDLLGNALPFLSSKISSLDPDLQQDNLNELFELLIDITEYQYISLDKCSAARLHECAVHGMVTFTKRLLTLSSGLNEVAENEITCMNLVLRLLDAFSTQEFTVHSENETIVSLNQASPLLEMLQEVDICEVVCVGVYVLSSVITVQLLLQQPKLQLRYFSLLVYVLSSTPEFIMTGSGMQISDERKLRTLCSSIGMGDDDVRRSFETILNLLLWAAMNSYDQAIVRLSLQGIQNCAVARISSRDSSSSVLTLFLDHCQEVFVEFLVNSATMTGSACSKSSLDWNRIDTFSYTFLTIIAHNSDRIFSAVLPRFIAQQQPKLQEPLQNLFVSLTNANGVNCNDIRKPNARLFAGNLRCFFDETHHLLHSV